MDFPVYYNEKRNESESKDGGGTNVTKVSGVDQGIFNVFPDGKTDAYGVTGRLISQSG